MWRDTIVLGSGVRGATMRGISALVRGPFRRAMEGCPSCTVRHVLEARCGLPCRFGADLKPHVSTPDHLSRADLVLTARRRTPTFGMDQAWQWIKSDVTHAATGPVRSVPRRRPKSAPTVEGSVRENAFVSRVIPMICAEGKQRGRRCFWGGLRPRGSSRCWTWMSRRARPSPWLWARTTPACMNSGPWIAGVLDRRVPWRPPLLPSPVSTRHRCDGRIRTVVTPTSESITGC